MANIYGVLPVLEALRAGARRIDRIIIAEGARDARLREVIEAARAARVPVRRDARVALDRLTHNANHQGVIAVTSAATYSDAEDLLDEISSGTIFILLDGVEDPHNLGAIIRTAECGGASAVIVPERRAAHLRVCEVCGHRTRTSSSTPHRRGREDFSGRGRALACRQSNQPGFIYRRAEKAQCL